MMINTNNNQVGEIVHKFYALAEDLEYNHSTDISASKYMLEIWSSNTDLAARSIESIVRDIGGRPRVAQFIAQTILEISDKDFYEQCFNISIKRSTPEMSRMLINSCLLFCKYEKAINRIDETVRKACQSFLNNKLEASTLLALVRQACIYGRKELHIDISSTLSLLNNKSNAPYIHISDRKSIEVISNGMAYGDTYLKEVVNNKKTQVYEKEAAIFSLGCESSPALHSYFNEIFDKFYYSSQTAICNEIIGAVVYGSYAGDVICFLVNHLEQLRCDKSMPCGFINLRHLHKKFVIKRFLIGCTYCLCKDSRLENELKLWLDNKNKDIQVFTILALEKQDIKCNELEKTLKSELKSERAFREDCIFYTDIIRLRQYTPYSCSRGLNSIPNPETETEN